MNYVVITGGAGFIGSNLIEFFLKKTKKKIISIDNYSTGSKKNHINNKRVKYLKGNTKNISKILNRYVSKIEVVFHFGEFSRIAQSFKKIQDCFQSNIEGTNNVLQFCLKNKIKIIYSATSASLGNNQNDQHLSPYAFSKSYNMNLIMNLNEWFDLNYEIIYFYNVYGKRQILTSGMAAVIGIFENCLKKNIPLPIVKPGNQSRRFTNIEDTVKTCYYAYKQNKNNHYSVSSNKSYKILDVAKLFSNKVRFIPERRGERFESKLVTKVRNKRVHNIISNMALKDYVKTLKQKYI